MPGKLAVLGGAPVFPAKIPIGCPTMPPFNELSGKIKEIIENGNITNGKYVKEFEKRTAEVVGAKNAVALSSCTSGLMLVLKALGLTGEVIVPSFTFTATVHAIFWNGLQPVFVDCDEKTFNLDPAGIKSKITKNTSAIMAVYIYGNPPAMAALEKIAKENNLKLIFDAAHGLGAKYRGLAAGNFGDAEVFSLSPTKPITAGEGGLVLTGDDELAYKLRIGRDYGNPGNYDCEVVGLNARMEEFNAILGLRNLQNLEKNIISRNHLAGIYRSLLGQLPGISFQTVEKEDRSSYKDFSILINRAEFGLDRNILAFCLDKENISTKKYFSPPVHQQKACRSVCGELAYKLPVTEKVSANILSLPIYAHLEEAVVRKICAAMAALHDSRETIGNKMKSELFKNSVEREKVETFKN